MNYKEYLSAIDRLNRASELYYKGEEPIMTDDEWDTLKKKIKEFEGSQPELVSVLSPTQTIGAGNGKVKHLTKMYSMEDLFTIEEVKEWMDKVGLDRYVMEYKYDGASLNLIYKNGVLYKAITRGNGEEGDDVTHLTRGINDIPLNIEYKGLIEISGEVIIPKDLFDKINDKLKSKGLPTYSNPRNLAAGSLNLKDVNQIRERHLYFKPWRLGYNDLNNKTYTEDMNFIFHLGFKRTEIIYFTSISDIEKEYNRVIENRDEIPFMIDGLVIKVDEKSKQEELGHTSKYPKWMVAFKLPAVEKVTRVEDVIYQVGRTGTVTPVVKLEPVEIGGVIVSRVTMYNCQQLKDKDIKIGDSAVVIRSGDVIPKLIKVFKDRRTGNEVDIKIPEVCPVCETKLVKIGPECKCENIRCRARVLYTIKHFVNRDAMDINVGEETIKKMLELGLIKDPSNLYELTYEDIVRIPGFADKSIRSLLNSIQNSRRVTLDRFIYALGIELVGKSTAKLIAENLGMDFFKPDLNKLLDIRGIGGETVVSINEYFNFNSDYINKLLTYIDIVNNKKQGPLSGKKVCLTGKFKIPRRTIVNIIEDTGGTVTGNVTKDTDILLVGENPSSKLDKAKKLAIEIVTLQELMKKFNIEGV